MAGVRWRGSGSRRAASPRALIRERDRHVERIREIDETLREHQAKTRRRGSGFAPDVERAVIQPRERRDRA